MKPLINNIKKVNWELTPELHLNDGKHYGGAVLLYFHRDVQEAINKALKDICDDDEIIRATFQEEKLKHIFKQNFGDDFFVETK